MRCSNGKQGEYVAANVYFLFETSNLLAKNPEFSCFIRIKVLTLQKIGSTQQSEGNLSLRSLALSSQKILINK